MCIVYSLADCSVYLPVSSLVLWSFLHCNEQASRPQSISHTPASCHSDLSLFSIAAPGFHSRKWGLFTASSICNIVQMTQWPQHTYLNLMCYLLQFDSGSSGKLGPVFNGFIWTCMWHGSLQSNFIPQRDAGYLPNDMVAFLWLLSSDSCGRRDYVFG